MNAGHAGKPAALRERARRAVMVAVGYLHGRQSFNGGFCFYRWQGVDEPNLHDTWHAVAALTLVGTEVPSADETASSLDGYMATSPEALYQRAFALDRLGCVSRLGGQDFQRIRDLQPAAALASNAPIGARLGAVLHILCLQRRFAVLQPDAAIVDDLVALRRDGGWGDKPNLGDTWRGLAILHMLETGVPPEDTRDFVDALQVASLGFTVTRDSLAASLDTVCAGFGACALLGLPVRHRDDALDYLLACQSSNGGFARTPDALPNIACTHRALQALGVAGAIDVGPDSMAPGFVP
jgi:hypothetical protein